MSPTTCILLPVYNEEDSIMEVVSALRAQEIPFIVVNDGSTDRTEELLRINNVTHLCYTKNKGKGYAIKYGANYLIKEGIDYILIMDSDGQNSLSDITQFFTALKMNPDAKIIIGNRLHNPKTMPGVRYYTNRCMSWLISKMAKQSIPDTQCGMRLVHKDIFKMRTKSNRFEYESEQLIKAGRKGYKVVSVPIQCIYKKERDSKISPFKDSIRFIRMIITFVYIRKQKLDY